MENLNHKEFMGVSDRQQLRKKLTDKQSQMRDSLLPQSMLDEEKLLRTELINWSLIEEGIYK